MPDDFIHQRNTPLGLKGQNSPCRQTKQVEFQNLTHTVVTNFQNDGGTIKFTNKQ